MADCQPLEESQPDSLHAPWLSEGIRRHLRPFGKFRIRTVDDNGGELGERFGAILLRGGPLVWSCLTVRRWQPSEATPDRIPTILWYTVDIVNSLIDQVVRIVSVSSGSSCLLPSVAPRGLAASLVKVSLMGNLLPSRSSTRQTTPRLLHPRSWLRTRLIVRRPVLEWQSFSTLHATASPTALSERWRPIPRPPHRCCCSVTGPRQRSRIRS